jgi:tetratricopeptide (TPR) repeat protein
MVNPYAPPASSTAPLPIVRPIYWPAVIPQCVALSGAIAIGWFWMRSSEGVFWGAAAYLLYSFGSRSLIPRAHRRGSRLMQGQQYEAAIKAFENSYAFFSRHSWLDRFRSITMMSPGAMCFREMALINIAAAYAQLGDGAMAKHYYQRAATEFPGSVMARGALVLIESVERSQASTSDG